jgi:hypothetical protein
MRWRNLTRRRWKPSLIGSASVPKKLTVIDDRVHLNSSFQVLL